MMDKFMSMFKDGYAPANRFAVEFVLPPGISPNAPGGNENSKAGRIQAIQSMMNGGKQKINLLCHTASFPQRSLMTYEHKQMNAPYRIPYSQEYQPTSFVFYADGKMHTREYFDIWQQAIVNIKNNTLNFMSEYVSDVIMRQLNKEGKPVYNVKLYQAYPSMVSAMDYGMSNNNTIQNVAITMMYKYWEQI